MKYLKGMKEICRFPIVFAIFSCSGNACDAEFSKFSIAKSDPDDSSFGVNDGSV